MSNIVDFPIKDIGERLVRNIRHAFTDEQWSYIGPVIHGLVKRHGTLPPFTGAWQPPGLDNLTADELEATRVGINNMIVECARVYRAPLIMELSQVLIENSQLKKQLADLQKESPPL